MPIPLSDVTLAILAGGEGSRMGKPKAELQIAGEPILAYLLNRFAWPGPTLLVTAPARGKPPAAGRFDREAMDAVAGEGPLRGVLTALEACNTQYLFITTVDMPGIGRTQAEWFLHQLAARDASDLKLQISNLESNPSPRPAGVMCRRNGRVEPFPSAFHATAAASIRERMSAGERSVHSLAGTICDALPCPDWPPDVWTNLNRPEDLAAWAATL